MYRFLIAILLAVGFGCPAFAQVTNNCTQVINGVTTPVPCGVTIGGLTSAASPTGTEIVPISQGGNTVGATLNQVKTFVGNGLSPGTVTDTMAALSNKPSAFLASTTNVASLSGLPTIDGVTMTRAGVVLLTGQTTQSQNGPWCVPASGTWARCPWYPTAGTVQAFVDATIQIRAGTAYSGALFKLATPTSGTITIDTTATTWTVSPVALGSVAPQAPGTIVGLGTNASGPSTPITLVRTDFYATDYGVVGDGTTNDQTAVNAVTAALRTTSTLSLGGQIHFPADKNIFTTGPLNFTGIRNYYAVIDFNGSQITCSTSGQHCVDATQSDHLTWISPSIIGSTTNPPDIGFNIGRLAAGGTDCGEQRIYNLKTNGTFTFSGVYDVACETNTWYSPHFQNNSTTSGTYAVVIDCINHFGLSSTFVTVTLPTNSANSCDENLFISPVVVGSSTGNAPIWMSGTTRHRWESGYVLSQGSPQDVDLYDNSVQTNYQLYFDVHLEGNGSFTDCFLLTGSNATPILPSFTYIDQQGQCSTGYFKLDTGVTSVTATDMRVQQTQTGNAVALFEAPSAWTVTGDIQVGSADTTAVSSLASFYGRYCRAGVCSNGGNLNLQGPNSAGSSTQFTCADVNGNLLLQSAICSGSSSVATLEQSGITFVMPSSGTIGNNGALSAITALPRTISGGAYFFFPAAAIAASGAGSSAGWYWTVMSSTTAGTIYNSTYSSGHPALGATTAFTTTGPGAYTQTTSATPSIQITVAGNTLGVNGALETQVLASCSAAASNKIIYTSYGGTTMGFVTTNGVTTTSEFGALITMTNQGVTNAQVGIHANGGGDFTPSNSNMTLGAVDSTANQTFKLNMQITTPASDWVIMERHSIKVVPST